MATSTSATSTNANIVSATSTSAASYPETSRASDDLGGIGSTSSTISSAATTTAVAKPGFFGKVSAFACSIIDRICKAFEKCFASIKGLFGRPDAASKVKQAFAWADLREVLEAVRESDVKQALALADLRAVLESDKTSNEIVYNAYGLVKDDIILQAIKKGTYVIAKDASDDMGVENGFDNPDWAGEAIKRNPKNKYVIQSLTNLIAYFQ